MRAEPAVVSRERYEGKGAAGRFYGGDTLLLMDELLRRYAGEVKLIYMDPPFLTGEQFIMRARVGAADWKAGKGSLVLPAFSDDMEPDAYYAMMRRVLEGSHSLLREDGMLFLHCDLRASARLRLIMDDIFGEKNLLNEIVWVYHTGGMARRYFSRKARYHPFLSQDGQVRFQHRRRALPAHGAEAEPHAPPRGPRWPRLPLHPLRRPRLYLLRRRPRAAHRRLGRCQPPATARPPAHRLRHAKAARPAHAASCAAPPGRANWSSTPLPARAPRSKPPRAKAAASGRGHVSAGAQHTAPPPGRRAVGAFARGGDGRRRLHSGSAARRGLLPCRACGHPHAVGDARQLGAGLSARRGNCAWIRRRCARKKAPELPRELELPVYDGEIGLRLCDVRGKTYYYKLPYEKN